MWQAFFKNKHYWCSIYSRRVSSLNFTVNVYTQLRFWINNVVDVYTSWFRILEGFMPDWYLTLVFPLNLSLYDSVESHIASASLSKNFIMVCQYCASQYCVKVVGNTREIYKISLGVNTLPEQTSTIKPGKLSFRWSVYNISDDVISRNVTVPIEWWKCVYR